MTIQIPPELERLVREHVDRGGYESVESLVENALYRLIQDDGVEDGETEKIRAAVQAGAAEIDRGDFVEFDESTILELTAEVHQRGLKRLAAEREESAG